MRGLFHILIAHHKEFRDTVGLDLLADYQAWEKSGIIAFEEINDKDQKLKLECDQDILFEYLQTVITPENYLKRLSSYDRTTDEGIYEDLKIRVNFQAKTLDGTPYMVSVHPRRVGTDEPTPQKPHFPETEPTLIDSHEMITAWISQLPSQDSHPIEPKLQEPEGRLLSSDKEHVRDAPVIPQNREGEKIPASIAANIKLLEEKLQLFTEERNKLHAELKSLEEDLKKRIEPKTNVTELEHRTMIQLLAALSVLSIEIRNVSYDIEDAKAVGQSRKKSRWSENRLVFVDGKPDEAFKFGDLILFNSSLLQIFRSLSVRDVWRCMRLSKSINAFLRAHCKQLEIGNVPANVVIVLPGNCNGYLQLLSKTVKDRHRQVITLRTQNSNQDRVTVVNENCFLPDPFLNVRKATNISDAELIREVFEQLALQFTFDRVEFSSETFSGRNSNEKPCPRTVRSDDDDKSCTITSSLEQEMKSTIQLTTTMIECVALLPRIADAEFGNLVADPSAINEALSEMSNLKKLRICRGSFQLDKSVFEGKLVSSLTNLSITFENDSSMNFDNVTLLKLKRLTNLKLQLLEVLTEASKIAPTSVTFYGIRRILLEYQHGERDIVHYSLSVQGSKKLAKRALPPDSKTNKTRPFECFYIYSKSQKKDLNVTFTDTSNDQCRISIV